MSSKIEKKDLKTIYRRYLALNCMNDYPGQMHNGLYILLTSSS